MKRFVLYGFLIALSLTAVGQISPGDLSKAHTDLEGIGNCTKCHELGKKVTNEKCLDCHKEIASRINQKSGFHSSTEVNGKSCTACHNEHHGLDFNLIDLDEKTFDHNLTGYRLEGAHAKEECRSCHKHNFITDSEVRDNPSTFLGLSQNCITCHDDYHRETLTDQCTDCHNYVQFAPAPGFNHDLSDFKLEGSHSQVDCAGCHKRELIDGKSFQHFSDVPHQNCTSCHKDIHENKFGQNCTKCHTVQSFRNVAGLSEFDHNKTGYPLEGKHAELACNKCHPKSYTQPLKHNNCKDCHSDYHKGDFTQQGKSTDCNSCHVVTGFQNSLFTLEMHNEKAFKLEGAHMATPCFACHLKEDTWRFRHIGSNCMDCHQNIHEGYLDETYTTNNGCSNCHSVHTWHNLTFDHDKTAFSLEGTHATTSCKSCHFREDDKGQVHQKFSMKPLSCLECHKDEHQGQFKKYGDNGCVKCHSYTGWGIETFNHDQTAFKLEGAHAELKCFECHQEERISGERCIKYTYKETKCATCHK